MLLQLLLRLTQLRLVLLNILVLILKLLVVAVNDLPVLYQLFVVDNKLVFEKLSIVDRVLLQLLNLA